MSPLSASRLRAMALSILPLWSCATAAPPQRPTFTITEVSSSIALIHFETPGVPPDANAEGVFCSSVALALERDYDYFRMKDRRQHGEGKGSFKLELLHEPPVSAQVINPRNKELLAGDGDRAVVDAKSFSARCRRAGIAPAKPANAGERSTSP
jgi:hypothetical protein